jgi:CubicO group peptidase (beta-lactamase class C family)
VVVVPHGMSGKGRLHAMSSKWVLLLLGTLGGVALAWSQDLGEWTDSYIKALAPAKHFRGTILVERNGQLLIQKNYGIAVEEWQIPISSDTRFEIASLSKQLTAAAILQLADSGKLNVEDTVSKYYPDSPPAWKG